MSTSPFDAIRPASWAPLDPDYRNRRGYDAAFLDRPVAPPALADAIKGQATVPPLPYEHFSILLNPERRLAYWTAVNIDGQQERHLGDRQPDVWWFDERKTLRPPLSPELQVGPEFYKGSGFQRGHLVRRLDPAWGRTAAESARGEADTFHWTNCSPQVPVLNTRWWLGVENHILETANANDRKVSVFSGCVFDDADPLYRGVAIPLAFWKVAAWTVDGASLRSLAFVVRQDDAVAALIRKARIEPRAVDFDEVPKQIQGYQMSVEALERLVQLRFGELARPEVDVFARGRTRRQATRPTVEEPEVQPLESVADLITR